MFHLKAKNLKQEKNKDPVIITLKIKSFSLIKKKVLMQKIFIEKIDLYLRLCFN